MALHDNQGKLAYSGRENKSFLKTMATETQRAARKSHMESLPYTESAHRHTHTHTQCRYLHSAQIHEESVSFQTLLQTPQNNKTGTFTGHCTYEDTNRGTLLSFFVLFVSELA